MASSVFNGPIAGRFFKIDDNEQVSDFFGAARQQAWSAENSRGKKRYLGFCVSEPPHGGDLSEERTDLGYDDDGSGVVRFWLREDVRKPKTIDVKSLAASMARGDGYELRTLGASARREYTDQAKESLVESMRPNVRVVPGVMFDDRIWIGRRAASADGLYRKLFFNITGAITVDPVCWDPIDNIGWYSMSTALLQHCVKTRSIDLDADTQLMQLQLGNDSIKLQAGGIDGQTMDIIQQAAKLSPKLGVSKATLSVLTSGERTHVVIDAEGLVKAIPPRSTAGLAHERIRRRMSDALEAAQRAGEVLKALVEELSVEE